MRRIPSVNMQKRREHCVRAHNDWYSQMEGESDDLVERYHRADHERAGANDRHTHPEYEDG